MATIKKYIDKDGKTRYQFQVYLGTDPQTGKKKTTRRRGFKTKSEATIALSRITYDVKTKGTVQKKNNILFIKVYHEWYSEYINTVRESTWAKTAGMFKNHILPLFGDKRLETITVNQCQQAVNQWFKETTRNYKRWYNYLSNVFDYGIKHGYINNNPAKMITLPKQPDTWGKKPENFWNKDQLKTFFKHIDKEKESEKYCLFRVLAFCGVRRGECLALTWNDIDFKHGTLSVNKTLTQGEGGKQIIQAPKTKKSRRIILLDNTTAKILKGWRKQQLEYYSFLGINTLQKNQLIFANSRNHFKSLNTPAKWLNKIITDNDLKPKISIHGFRHSHASALFAAGATIKEVQNRLGHEDVATTLNIYTHVTKDQDKEAIQKLTRYLDF